jgi:cytochrome P450
VAADEEHSARLAALNFLRSADARADWKSLYGLFRAHSPLELGDSQWLLSTWHDVTRGLAHPTGGLSTQYPIAASPPVNELHLGMLQYQGGERHRCLRALSEPFLSKNIIPRLTPAIRTTIANALFPTAFGPAGCDVVAGLGLRLPTVISGRLLDLPEERWEIVGAWGRAIYRAIGHYDLTSTQTRQAEEAVAGLTSYVLGGLANDVAARTDIGITANLLAARARGELDDHNLVAYVSLFLVTGLDTITYAVGNAVWFLGNDKRLFRCLSQSPELAEAIFAEAMRLWGPIRLCVRRMETDLRLANRVVPAGSTVFMLIHAANTDPQHFGPEDIDSPPHIHRPELAYGLGSHSCLGARVARLAGKELFQAIADQCETLRVAPGPDPTFVPSLQVLGVPGVQLMATPRHCGRQAS